MSARPARAAAARGPAGLPLSAAAGVRVRALRLVAPVRVRAGRLPFVAVVVGTLAFGLVGLIIISTTLQDQAFALADLKSEARSLNLQQQRLQREVDELDSPASAAQKAITLGMVPNEAPVFLRLADGRVVGTPTPAKPGTNLRRIGR